MDEKRPYICGPLTELPPDVQPRVKRFYERIANHCESVLGTRGFIPHEHYDPLKHARYTPREVDDGERRQVCMKTSVLIVVAVAPSWGGGIEVEMARQSNVPVILLCEKEKLEQRRISRLLRGNPAVRATIAYASEDDALVELSRELTCVFNLDAQPTAR